MQEKLLLEIFQKNKELITENSLKPISKKENHQKLLT